MRPTLYFVVVTVFCACRSAPVAGAAERLVWEFARGDFYTVSFQQQTVTRRTIGTRRIDMSIKMEMTMTWKVDSVADSGDAVVTQVLTRLGIQIVDKDGGRVSFDTSDNEKPTGVAAQLAQGLLPIINRKFAVTISPQGEIVAVSLSQTPVAEQKLLFSQSGIQTLLNQVLIPLPNSSLEIGDSWKREDQESGRVDSYTLESVDKAGDARIARQTSFPTNDQDDRNKPQQEFSGTVWFKGRAGRLDRASFAQTLASETNVGGVPVRVETKTESRLQMATKDE